MLGRPRGNGAQEKIAIVPNGEGYRCELNRDLLGSSGLHRIVVEATKDGDFVGRGEREFVILDRDKEKANPAANPQQMARLASQTAEYGGVAIQPEQLSALLDEYIAVFVLLLAVEWGLRKKWGLV